MIDTSIANLINNICLNREAESSQLQPSATSLTKKSEESNIADTCEEWNMFLEVEELSYHKCKIKERYRQAVTPSHLLAILHPKYMGQGLISKATRKARNVLIESLNP